MADPDCIFCKIVSGELPSHKLAEDESTLSFLDINPWTRGHSLVIPKEHSRNIYDIDEDDLAASAAAAKQLALRLREHLKCAGVNLVQSSERVAMQTVFHFHIHVIPRYEDDGLRLPAHPKPTEHDELAGLAEEMREQA